MKFILSRFEHNMDWMKDYEGEYIIYDRSEVPMPGANVVPNVGSDIRDKFTYIIDHYDNLPEVAIYAKANIFKYITRAEFDKVKDNKTFTPLFTQGHPEIMCDEGILEQIGLKEKKFSYYENGMYYEFNYPAYLKHHHLQNRWYEFADTYLKHPLLKLLGIDKMEYIPFAPGSNYILTRENILKHPKLFYEELRSYLEWDKYPGECMLMERGLLTLWQ